MEETTTTTNINAKWLENIYENIKRIEEHERLAREGCINILEYIKIPPQHREIVLGDVQFKNLRYLVTEFSLLLADLSPTIKPHKLSEFRVLLDNIEDNLLNRRLFVKDVYNTSRQLTQVKLTDFFNITLKFLSRFKIDLFMEIKHILYIQAQEQW